MAQGPEGALAVRTTVRSGDVDISVAEWGDRTRPTVVLLHGYPDSKEVWSEVAEQLSERFHVVAYDIRGHGASSAPARPRGGYRLARLADDFEAVLRAVCPDRPVHLVGHDWGSVQGWEFATLPRFDGRLLSFTSMSGPCLDHLALWIKSRLTQPTPRRTAQLLGQMARSWYLYAFQVPVLPELLWRGPLGRWWPRLLATVEGIAVNDYPTPSLPRDAANGVWLYRDNVYERLSRPRRNAHARIPVQLIIPTRDLFLSPHLHDDLERWVPELRRHTVPAKHWLPRTRPRLLAQWISEFADITSGCREHRQAYG